MNGHFTNRLVWGLVIIGIGTMLMLRQSGIVQFDIGEVLSTFWPVILLFLGLKDMIRRLVSGHGSFSGAAVLIVIGGVFLGRNLELFDWSFSDIAQFAVPVVIILFGIRMIMKPKEKELPRNPSPSDEWKAYPYHTNEVPPAPPLHPDPTKAEPETPPVSPAPGSIRLTKEKLPPFPEHQPGPDEYQPWQPPLDTRFEERVREKIEKHQRRVERVSERSKGSWSSKGRVEWWNSDPNVQNRSGFIGDIYVGQDYWELKPMNISHFIGDTVLDLTKAQIPYGETRIHISSFIGDVKVFVPNDLETGIHVVSSAFIGDVAVLDQKDGGIFKNMDIETPFFLETDRKIKLVVSTFIGDVRVTKVG